MTKEQIAKATGTALGALVVDGIVSAVVEKASAEVSRLLKIQGEAETETTRLRDEASKWQKIVIDAKSKNGELQGPHDELQRQVEQLEATHAQLAPLVEELKAERLRAAGQALNILHGESGG